MTIRTPNQLRPKWNPRIMEKPESNIHLIFSEYSDHDAANNNYNCPPEHFDHIERVKKKYMEIQHWNPEWNLFPLKLIYVKTIEDAEKKLQGVNPFASSFLDHCDSKVIGQGDESWLSVDELAKFINSKHGNIWMVWISGCKSWHFGNNLQEKTEKILLMDARHKDKPQEGFEFCDGSNDEERRLRGTKIITNWSLNFCKIYAEKIAENESFDIVSWVINSARKSGFSPDALQNYTGNLQRAPL